MPVIAPVKELLEVVAQKALKGGDVGVGRYDLGGSTVLIEFKEGAFVVKGEDEEYTPTTSISMIGVLALFAQKAGIQGDRTLALLHEAMTASVLTDAENPSKQYIDAFTSDYSAVEARVQAALAAMPKKTRSGKLLVTGLKGKVEIKVSAGRPLSALSAVVPAI